jgi:hypothetical protein
MEVLILLSYGNVYGAIADWVWDLPKASTHWANLFSRWMLDNWELSGIASFFSGQPTTRYLDNNKQ